MAKVIKAGLTRYTGADTDTDTKKKHVSSPENEEFSKGDETRDASTDAEFNAAYEELIAAAQDEVGLMLGDARNEALTLIQTAETQANDIREIARTEGYREGLERAAGETAEILSNGQKQADEITARANAEHKRLIDGLEPQVYKLAFEVAEKILGLELDRSDEAFMSILNNAMESVKAEQAVTLRVNSSEYDRFFNARSITLNTSRGGIEAKVNIDPVVQPGGLIIETESGAIDAGAHAQLEQIKSELS